MLFVDMHIHFDIIPLVLIMILDYLKSVFLAY